MTKWSKREWNNGVVMSNIMDMNKSKSILFSVQGGGCNGLKYNLEPLLSW